VLVAKGYRPVQRDQEFLMPPNMRLWLPPEDPVWLVIETVAALDTSKLHAQRSVGGAGRAGYHPDMLLTLLIWGWAQGQRSSRKLEMLCKRDVAYRIICAGDAPDHATISRFRAQCAEVVEDLFAEVLALCARLGMGQVGVVALDGVKIASNASKSANRTEEGLREALAAEAARASAEHTATDTAENQLHGDDHGGHLPQELSDPSTRRARIEQAIAEFRTTAEQSDAEQSDAEQSDQVAPAAEGDQRQREQVAERAREARNEIVEKARERRNDGTSGVGKGTIPVEIEVEVLTASRDRAVAAQQAKIDRYRPGQRGPRPKSVQDSFRVQRAQDALDRAEARQRDREIAAAVKEQLAEEAARAAQAKKDKAATDARGFSEPQRNITDPESRMMPLRGGGWVQGFNCQAVTSSDGLIIATGVNNNPADVVAFAPMLTKTVAAAKTLNDHRPPGTTSPDLPAEVGVLLADAGYLSEANLTADGPDRLIATGKSRALKHAARDHPTSGAPPADATPIEAMAHRLATPEGHDLYRRRSHIAETPFGHAKHNLGFRQFTSCGLARATAEFAFHAMVNNITKAINTKKLTLATI